MKIKTMTIPGFLSILIVLFNLSCSTVSYENIYPILVDGKYDSEFPYKGCSAELERISTTVHRINSTAFYRTYIFDKSLELTLNDLQENTLSKIESDKGYADQSSSGTGTIIYYSEGRVALLTCAHVVNYPDTIVTFFSDEDGNLTDILESIFIKERQMIYVAGFPEGSALELLAIDKKLDVAIIGRDYRALSGIRFPVFSYPVGRAKDLEWGTFVYVFGFPLNYQMVTKGLVSNPNKDGRGSFVIDAVINEGASGAVVLAIRDGIPNFELVGIVQWVPEVEDNILIPQKLKNNEPYNSILPYEGKEYVKRFSSMRYGIAHVISIESIITFLESEKEILYEAGYYFEDFLGKIQ